MSTYFLLWSRYCCLPPLQRRKLALRSYQLLNYRAQQAVYKYHSRTAHFKNGEKGSWKSHHVAMINVWEDRYVSSDVSIPQYVCIKTLMESHSFYVVLLCFRFCFISVCQSYSVAQDSPALTALHTLTSEIWLSSCSSLPSAEISSLSHHALPKFMFLCIT